jgi:endonuclease/exonuclease/phosphatase family metal-dependent hydrolase
MGRSQRISAGTAILVDRATSPYIRDHDILIDGRAQYVTLLSPEGSSLTIINIYAQQTSNERASIWAKITQGNFESDHILVGGDFNHLEEITRRGVPGTRQIHRREASAWHRMTLRYGLADAWELGSFRKMSKKSFTFDNGRSGRQAAVSRIDKFMVSQGIEERGGRVESVASIRKLSDHSPLTIKIWGTHPPTKKQTRFFDATLLSEENGKAKMLQAWSGETARPSSGRDWATWLEEAIGRVVDCNARLAKEKGRARGTRVRSCTKKIQLAEIQLQRDPENVEVRGLLSEAQGELAEEFQDSVARNRHISSANWLRYGDTCSKTFFDFHRIGKKKALMRELETDFGTVSGQHDLAHYVTSFYTRLYTSDADSPGMSAA